MGNGVVAGHVGKDVGVRSKRSGQVRDLGSSPAILCTVIGGVFALVVGVLGWLVMDVNSAKARAVENSIALARVEAKLDAQADRLDNMDATLIRIEKKLDLLSVPRTNSPVPMDGNGSGQVPASFAFSQGYGWKMAVGGSGPRCLAHSGYFLVRPARADAHPAARKGVFPTSVVLSSGLHASAALGVLCAPKPSGFRSVVQASRSSVAAAGSALEADALLQVVAETEKRDQAGHEGKYESAGQFPRGDPKGRLGRCWRASGRGSPRALSSPRG